MTITINGTTGITTPGLTNSGSLSTAGLTLSSGSISFADSSTLPSATFSPVYPITASVASNAMTVTLNACALVFRSTTLGSGSTSTVTIASPISVTVPSSATLGTVNATQSRIVVLAMNNGGTAELAVVNIAGGNQLDETTLISTTAISAAATSSSTIYSTTARTNLAYRVIGYVESTQATAGTWATAPSTIQGYGGQALAAMSSVGYGQTPQSLGASRVFGTTYYNTTGKPIFVAATYVTSGNVDIILTVNGTGVCRAYANSYYATVVGIVPPGASYVVTNGPQAGQAAWFELR